MSEPGVPPVDLSTELRAYFALTTSTELPRNISRMSVRSLQERRSGHVAALFAGGFGLLVAAALAFVVVAHPGSQSGTSSSSSFGGIAGSAGPDVAKPLQGTVVAYPGVDTGKLASSGVVLRIPDGHVTVALSPAQAQAAAIHAVAGTDAQPGPAVLASVALLGGQQPDTCLCWVIDVPVPGVHFASPGAAFQLHTALVLVDAADGRIVATLTGHGVP